MRLRSAAAELAPRMPQTPQRDAGRQPRPRLTRQGRTRDGSQVRRLVPRRTRRPAHRGMPARSRGKDDRMRERATIARHRWRRQAATGRAHPAGRSRPPPGQEPPRSSPPRSPATRMRKPGSGSAVVAGRRATAWRWLCHADATASIARCPAGPDRNQNPILAASGKT